MVVVHMDRSRFAPTLVHIGQDGWFAETELGALPDGQGRLLLHGWSGYVMVLMPSLRWCTGPQEKTAV